MKMTNCVRNFEKALEWIKTNTISGNGIAVSSKEQIIYPEVTGYYIPTLLEWGERDLACAYAKYLMHIQKEDGSWYDSLDKEPYVFDSAQILKGLVAIRDIIPEADEHIKKGCDWILSNMQPDGRLTTPNKEAWGKDENFCSELVHLYCLSPIRDAARIFGNLDYEEKVNKIIAYYKKEKFDKITNFSLLSHFYAYVMEALYDLGEIELCRESMMRLEKYRNAKGGIPGLNDVPWVCSTGMFQLAVVWYKLGDLERGNSLFNYALSLQNETGGWYGSYPAPSIFSSLYRGRKKPYYFPNVEISWAVKYFLDALALKERLEFEKMASSFIDSIDENDGRYVLIKNLVALESETKERALNICDIGCGKGRYLKRLVKDLPNNNYFASDISKNVTESINCINEVCLGMLTSIPYEDESFDVVYTCEAFEHAINIRGAFKELCRVTKREGVFIIIDKPLDKIGNMKLYAWEQWISDDDMKRFSDECDCSIQIVPSVAYENGKDDGLFRAWLFRKEK